MFMLGKYCDICQHMCFSQSSKLCSLLASSFEPRVHGTASPGTTTRRMIFVWSHCKISTCYYVTVTHYILLCCNFWVHSSGIEKDDQLDHVSDGLNVGRVKFAWTSFTIFDVWTST